MTVFDVVVVCACDCVFLSEICFPQSLLTVAHLNHISALLKAVVKIRSSFKIVVADWAQSTS